MMRSHPFALPTVAVVVTVSALAACGGKDDAKPTETKSTSTAKAGSSGAPSAKAVGSASPDGPPSVSATAVASAAPSSTPSAAPASTVMPVKASGDFPDTETKPPQPKEWDEKADFIRVTHAATLWCETRTMREWVRVSCRAKGSGNTPKKAEVVTKPNRGQYYVFNKEDVVASVVFQPRKNQTSVFEFTWSNWGTRRLSVTWPGGNTQPTLAFDAPGPTSKQGLPKCEDTCPVGGLYFQPMSDCAYGCGDGYTCAWVGTGNERTAFCNCNTECGDD